MLLQDFKYRILLGSASPRRKELLSQLGFKFEVRVREVNETYPTELSPEDVPLFLAEKKASMFTDLSADQLLITADTVVICDNEVIGKPASAENAEGMLLKLSGKTHDVVTGMHLRTANHFISFSEVTHVEFAELELDEISWYVSNFKPLDKAGAYGIQDWIGARAIKRIEGSYTNVVGLPTERLYRELQSFD